jgi:predicted nucleic acid-binding protein
MTRLYVDSNILIAYYSTDKAEESKKSMVQRALEIFAHAEDISLCTSMWSVTEMVNVLISSKKMEPARVARIEARLYTGGLANLKLHILAVSPNHSYEFAAFFQDVRIGILKYHSGVGDVIHSVIMKNHGIDRILTFDEKDDFKQIPGLKVIHPRDVKINGK